MVANAALAYLVLCAQVHQFLVKAAVRSPAVLMHTVHEEVMHTTLPTPKHVASHNEASSIVLV